MKGTGRGWFALAAAAVTALASAQAAEGSTYSVTQCTSSVGHQANLEGGANYTSSNGCGTAAPYVQIAGGTPGGAAAGAQLQYAFSAPGGTRMNRVQGNFSLVNQADNGGSAPYFLYRQVGGSDRAETFGGSGSTAGSFDSQAYGWGNLDRVGVGMVCQHSTAQGPCPARSGIFGRIGQLTFSMQDTVPPDQPQVSGTIAGGGWHSGTRTLEIRGSDTGAGVLATQAWANDELIDAAFTCSPDTTRFRPCPAGGSDSGVVDVTQDPFTEGENSVRSCVVEYGTNAAVTCRVTTVQVDTVAPAAPEALDVEGGEGWRRDNGFDLTWQNPVQAHAPIVGATVVLERGGDRTSQYYPGDGISSIDDVEVDGYGEWMASVYLRDAAGNETAANVDTARLRYDETVPVEATPEIANGWINRADLQETYLQEWARPTIEETPPSGIQGYRAVLNTNSDTDPCSGAQDQRACSAPLTELGISNNFRTLGADDLVEGTNFVHVVAVSGSGMRATNVGHTALKVDLTDPGTTLQGDGNGEWMNHDADLALVANDPLSGMVDTDEFPFDAPPRVELTVDGQTTGIDGGQLSQSITAEGTHQVSWCARDLAGNGDCPVGGSTRASAGTATVRIDKSDPELAFTNSQDPDDPDRLVAPVSDALSGVAEGRISYRQAGGAEWKGLETQVAGDRLIARVDSGDMQPGVTYEFRAMATDRAGNSRTSTSKGNGEPMRVTGPFRATTEILDLAVNGKARARVDHGRKAMVSGTLLAGEGRKPVAYAPVRIAETFSAGSRTKTATRIVSTDGQGDFSVRLDKGPGRTIVATYGGDRRYLGTGSRPVKLSVRSRITMKVGRSFREDDTAVFRGRLRAKGAKLGKRGKRIEVQVRVGRGWRAVGRSFRTNGRGAFRLAYRFTADYTEPVTYEFRVVVHRERGFPYLPSKSKRRMVTVTP